MFVKIVKTKSIKFLSVKIVKTKSIKFFFSDKSIRGVYREYGKKRVKRG